MKKMEAETIELKTHLKLFQKVHSLFIISKYSGSCLLNLNCLKVNTVLSQKKVDKNDMDETIEESRELRRKLIDTQTNLAVVRSEMEKLRSEYEIKCEEFNNTYVTFFDCISVNQFTYTNNKHVHKYY